MNLSPEVAAVLRQALREAYAARDDRDDLDAYFILAEAIYTLLPPLQDVDKYLEDK